MEFGSAKEMEDWLEVNHSSSTGVWVRLYKKNSRVQSIKVGEALEVALAYGWITGQFRPCDDISWLGRFVPRRPRSIWSKVNVGIAERLMRDGRMRPAGLKQVEEAQKDGRWERAYHPPSTATYPPDFLAALERSPRAKAFARTLNRGNVYAIIFRIQNTKNEEKRRAKIDSIIRMLEEERTFH